MRELKALGIKGTGNLNYNCNTEQTASYSLFECPICLKKFELRTGIGKSSM